MNPQRLIYLYSDSVFTPWKENIFSDTIINLLKSTPDGYYPFVTHFVGFTDEFASFLKQFDMVFNVCYGFIDAGQADVAQWLDSHEIKHTASSYEIQILAKDKVNLPIICKEINVKTPEIIALSEIPESHYSRFIAKPRMGSLHLNMLVFEKGNIPYQALLERDDYIIQPYLTGREFTVGVVPNEDSTDYIALQPLEIRPNDNREIYIAGQNYGITEKILNPDLDNMLKNELMNIVLSLHKTMKIRGMSRTDVRIHEGQIFILDINTMPNLDTKSFLPLIAQNEGIDLKELIRKVTKMAEQYYVNMPLSVLN
ncbi:ATP-grasp domain-containing protein [Arcicella sp. LKC2W]|uniref:ATP-grasp domain-containing protein n=1 Tax=Arcicella sp. LKC2W TaxID=2984198 RepID=UPI002B21076F|nr:ATP-grasp domain-containing protein [Arcicella sp. LKC2W]MEA5460800.1 ATP-grasp domain-containing protein [Arcicella sp. LKC2W]